MIKICQTKIKGTENQIDIDSLCTVQYDIAMKGARRDAV